MCAGVLQSAFLFLHFRAVAFLAAFSLAVTLAAICILQLS
jgi:hypothetical protein